MAYHPVNAVGLKSFSLTFHLTHILCKYILRSVLNQLDFWVLDLCVISNVYRRTAVYQSSKCKTIIKRFGEIKEKF